MDIRFFASNPIFFFMGTEDGSRKTPACCRAGMYRIFQSADKNLKGYPIYWHNCVHTFNIIPIFFACGPKYHFKIDGRPKSDVALFSTSIQRLNSNIYLFGNIAYVTFSMPWSN